MGDIQEAFPDRSRIETPVVVVGGGPVGLLTAFELSRLGIPCLLAEQATETTKWPKMDLANCRTMEILRMLGIADELRSRKGAVGGDHTSNSIFYTSSGEDGHLITSWNLPSVNELRKIKHLVGADGGGSRVRKQTGIKLFGAPTPIAMFLVHFRSKELSQLRPFGRFWHMFPPFDGFIIDQDENETFTVHLALESLDQDVSKINPHEWVYKVLEELIDEILVSSPWRPNFAIAEHYLSPGGKVILAAHRNPPHGGYGMNSGMEDALAVAWRLAAIHKGYGGELLLQSYEDEQRPIMIRRLERCSRHVAEHFQRFQWYVENRPEVLVSAEGEGLRQKIKDQLDASGTECNDQGIELDSRYRSAIIFGPGDGHEEPEWDVKRYTPSTSPGSRVPHVFLKDQSTSTLDTLGAEWTLVSFASALVETNFFGTIATEIHMPFKTVVLANEEHDRQIWGYDLVLVRADGHVAWRGQTMPDQLLAKEILMVVTGQKAFSKYVGQTNTGVNSEVFPPLNQEYPNEKQVWVGARIWEAQSTSMNIE